MRGWVGICATAQEHTWAGGSRARSVLTVGDDCVPCASLIGWHERDHEYRATNDAVKEDITRRVRASCGLPLWRAVGITVERMAR